MARSSTTWIPGTRSPNAHKFPRGGSLNYNAKLTPSTVRRLRRKHKQEGITTQQIAEQMDMDFSTICKMLKGKTYKDVT